MDVSGRPEAWTIKYWSITRIAGCSLLEEVKYERGPTDTNTENQRANCLSRLNLEDKSAFKPCNTVNYNMVLTILIEF